MRTELNSLDDTFTDSINPVPAMAVWMALSISCNYKRVSRRAWLGHYVKQKKSFEPFVAIWSVLVDLRWISMSGEASIFRNQTPPLQSYLFNQANAISPESIQISSDQTLVDLYSNCLTQLRLSKGIPRNLISLPSIDSRKDGGIKLKTI